MVFSGQFRCNGIRKEFDIYENFIENRASITCEPQVSVPVRETAIGLFTVLPDQDGQYRWKTDPPNVPLDFEIRCG